MKKLIVIISLLISLCSCDILGHREIWDKLQEHEDRIQKLEEMCSRLNENISSIQTVLTALEENDYVTDVVKIMEDGIEIGYSITFAKGGTVTIYHGSDGTDASVPKIGIKKASDGQYYWTSDGEWLTDEDGAKIQAVVAGDGDGRYITPLFRIAEGIWYISYDGGNSWREFSKTAVDILFSEVTYDEDFLYITPTDGTVLRIPLIAEENVRLYQEAKNLVSRYQHQTYTNQKNTNENLVDIILFAGQSNSCGRAQMTDCTTEDDVIVEVPMSKAFSFNNTSSQVPVAITEPISANGTSGYGYIPSFLNSYFATTNRKVCACYKSVGGTMINKFVPYVLDDLTGEPTQTQGTYYKSMVQSINHAKTCLAENGFDLGEVLLVWCQGESEGVYLGNDNKYAITYEKSLTTDEQKTEWYKKQFTSIVDQLTLDVGLSTGFIIRIGQRNATDNCQNSPIINAHNQLGSENDNIVLVSTIFAGAKKFIKEDGTIRNLMRDMSHYVPEGYLRAGLEAGVNAGIYINSGKLIKPILLEYHTLVNDDSTIYERPVEKFLYNPCRIDLNYLKNL